MCLLVCLEFVSSIPLAEKKTLLWGSVFASLPQVCLKYTPVWKKKNSGAMCLLVCLGFVSSIPLSEKHCPGTVSLLVCLGFVSSTPLSEKHCPGAVSLLVALSLSQGYPYLKNIVMGQFACQFVLGLSQVYPCLNSMALGHWVCLKCTPVWTTWLWGIAFVLGLSPVYPFLKKQPLFWDSLLFVLSNPLSVEALFLGSLWFASIPAWKQKSEIKTFFFCVC